MKNDELPVFNRRRSPTLKLDSNHKFSRKNEGFFIFPDEIHGDSMMMNELTPGNSKEGDFDNISSSLQIQKHRRNPTAPNVFGFPRNFSSTPLFQRPVESLVDMGSFMLPVPTYHSNRRISNPNLVIPTNVDSRFEAIKNDMNVKFNPVSLEFIPSDYWNNTNITFYDMLTTYFQVQETQNSRFSNKLYNALKIVNHDPFYSLIVGVEWISDAILKVHGPVFARFLDLIDYENSLFGQEGRFANHGFQELTEKEIVSMCSAEKLEDIDFIETRALIHQYGVFTQNITEKQLIENRWIRAKRKHFPQ